MKKICAWCKKDLGEVPSGPDANPITHGICPDCAREALSFKAEPLAKFLDRFLYRGHLTGRLGTFRPAAAAPEKHTHAPHSRLPGESLHLPDPGLENLPLLVGRIEDFLNAVQHSLPHPLRIKPPAPHATTLTSWPFRRSFLSRKRLADPERAQEARNRE